MKTLLIVTCVLSINLVLGQEICPSGFVYWDKTGYCYRYFSNLLTFNDADSYCGTLAAACSLASIHSLSEDGFIRDVVVGMSNYYWIGLNDIGWNGDFVWTDHSSFVWSNWGCGEPNNTNQEDCTHANFGLSHRWNDENCSVRLSFVCKVLAN
ncbi:C-type lectin mannose-binding isoform-like [Saccoglossus kowalevskii]|uniref:Alpha-N-acetylgalactosamine-specific lectin-like n=1 Tax=Saccoglossus kowalevskii TaxID=10224 RepID=A0ABM0MUL8_SACKO|nr:PREDICTED: alpha-N-acetylgalactosamine-specific lectin-like [Saccoglossus kowalevskii]